MGFALFLSIQVQHYFTCLCLSSAIVEFSVPNVRVRVPAFPAFSVARILLYSVLSGSSLEVY